jgi:uncharacterized protein YgiM (DUF1202 family)
MKTNCWLVLGTMIATSALAQVSTNTLPVIPAPAITPSVAPVAVTNHNNLVTTKKKSAATTHKKKAVAKTTATKPVVKKAAELPVTLVPGPATVAVENLNLRGQAGLNGEVVGHAKKGDAVTVIAEINLDKAKAGEPAQWAKIALPSGTKVWLNNKFIDATNKVVSVKKLNLRGGPGENYSVLGNLEKGAAITTISSKGDWTQIEAPTNAFAFVAASYLKQEAQVIEPANPAPPVVAVAPPVPATPTTVVEPPAVVPVPATPPVTPETPATPPVVANVAPPVVPAVPPVPATVAPEIIDTNPPPPRVVSHEGYVRSSVSPVAPTAYELYDPATSNAIDYLYTTTTNLHLARYNGLKIVVTGEEGIEARWHDTPVLTIQKIYVIPEFHAPVDSKRVDSPRGSQRH